MSMTCSLFLTIGKVTPEVFFQACLFRAKERIGETDPSNVMVPAQPLTALVMIQSQFLFQFAVIQLHPPASLGDAHQPPHPRRPGTEPASISWALWTALAIPPAAIPPPGPGVAVFANREPPKWGSWRSASAACLGFLDAKPRFARPRPATARPALAGSAVTAESPAEDTAVTDLSASGSARADSDPRSKSPSSVPPAPRRTDAALAGPAGSQNRCRNRNQPLPAGRATPTPEPDRSLPGPVPSSCGTSFREAP